jgi:hypothetical protein
LPSEDWLVFDKSKWSKLTPPKDAKVGDTWNVDKDIVVEILRNFYPPTSNRDPSTNKVHDPNMKATVVSNADGVMRVRFDSKLNMKHRFFPLKDDDHHVEAKVVGYIDWDSKKGAIRDLRFVTETGTYANDNFGISVRLHKPKDAAEPAQEATGRVLPIGASVVGATGALAVVSMLLFARRRLI